MPLRSKIPSLPLPLTLVSLTAALVFLWLGGRVISQNHAQWQHQLSQLHQDSLQAWSDVQASAPPLNKPSASGQEVPQQAVVQALQLLPHLEAATANVAALLYQQPSNAAPATWLLADNGHSLARRWFEQHQGTVWQTSPSFALFNDQARSYLVSQMPVTPVNNSANKPMLVIWHDITEPYQHYQHQLLWQLSNLLLAWMVLQALIGWLWWFHRRQTQALTEQQDITLANKDRQAEASRQLLATISQAQAAYINAQNQQEALAGILERVLAMTTSRFGLIGEVLHDQRGAPYMRTLAININTWQANSEFQKLALKGIEFKNPYTLFGQVIRSGQALVTNQPNHHPHSSGVPHGHPHLESFAGLPLQVNGQLLGILALANSNDGYPDDFAEQLQPLLATLGQLLHAVQRDQQRELTQQRLQRKQNVLQLLNEIASLPKLNRHTLLYEALRLGAQFYGMQHALISQVEGDDLRVIAHLAETQRYAEGDRLPLAEHCCSLTLEQDDILALPSISESRHAQHPCAITGAINSYIGANLWVAGKRFGTVSFSSHSAREAAFDEADEEFLRLFSRWIGATLERLEHEEQIRQTRRFLQTVLDSATSVGITAIDTEGQITLFNTGAERLLGYNRAEVIGQHTPQLYHLEEELIARAKQLSQMAGRPVSTSELFTLWPYCTEPQTQQWTYVRKNGERRTVNLTLSPMYDSQGDISGYLGIASDIHELQLTTQALQISEQRFRSVVSNLPGAVYRCRADQYWTMIYLSAEIQAISGYSSEQLVNNRLRSFNSIIHPTDRELLQLSSENSETNSSFELTYRIKHADGHWVWVRDKGRVEHNKQGELEWISGFIWDISEQINVENMLNLSQQRFSNAFNTAPQGMALVSTEGRWLEVNQALCDMLGYSSQELLNRDYQSLTHPDDRIEEDLDIEDLLNGSTPAIHREKRYIDKQGRVVWVLLSASLVRNSHGEPVHFVAQIYDFSERIRTEAAIREREEYLKTLLDNVLDAIITFDPQGYIESFNHAAERIFGYSHLEASGHRISMLIADTRRSLQPRHLSSYLRSGVKQVLGKEIELLARRSNGEIFTVELAISQISHQNEKRFIAVIRDIEERKRIERMKNEFVATVSHELRTPLTAIAGSLGLINGGVAGPVPEAMQHMLHIAENNSQRLKLLINDLLDMEKLLAGEMHFELKLLPLQHLLEQAIEHNQPYAEPLQVELRLAPPPTPCHVLVDPLRFSQILANLLSNAAKFSPAKQRVDVSVETFEQQVRINVRDYGRGIPDEFKTRMFSKFSQADASDTRQRGGTGLGLAICKEIVLGMNGQIGFTSHEGQGTTFWFELPLHPHPAPETH